MDVDVDVGASGPRSRLSRLLRYRLLVWRGGSHADWPDNPWRGATVRDKRAIIPLIRYRTRGHRICPRRVPMRMAVPFWLKLYTTIKYHKR